MIHIPCLIFYRMQTKKLHSIQLLNMVIWKLSNYCSSTEQIRTLRTPRMKLHSTSPLFMEGKKSLKKFVCTPKSCRNFFLSSAVLDSKLSSFSKFSRAVLLPLDALAEETLPSSAISKMQMAKNTFFNL